MSSLEKSAAFVKLKILLIFGYIITGVLEGKMINAGEWIWIVDRDNMTCRNEENDVTVEIHLDGKEHKGILKYMPVNLFAEIAKYRDGERIIESIVKKAEEEYLNFTHPR